MWAVATPLGVHSKALLVSIKGKFVFLVWRVARRGRIRPIGPDTVARGFQRRLKAH